jgi:hypothetical protein
MNLPGPGPLVSFRPRDRRAGSRSHGFCLIDRNGFRRGRQNPHLLCRRFVHCNGLGIGCSQSCANPSGQQHSDRHGSDRPYAGANRRRRLHRNGFVVGDRPHPADDGDGEQHRNGVRHPRPCQRPGGRRPDTDPGRLDQLLLLGATEPIAAHPLGPHFVQAMNDLHALMAENPDPAVVQTCAAVAVEAACQVRDAGHRHRPRQHRVGETPDHGEAAPRSRTSTARRRCRTSLTTSWRRPSGREAAGVRAAGLIYGVTVAKNHWLYREAMRPVGVLAQPVRPCRGVRERADAEACCPGRADVRAVEHLPLLLGSGREDVDSAAYVVLAVVHVEGRSARAGVQPQTAPGSTTTSRI